MTRPPRLYFLLPGVLIYGSRWLSPPKKEPKPQQSQPLADTTSLERMLLNPLHRCGCCRFAFALPLDTCRRRRKKQHGRDCRHRCVIADRIGFSGFQWSHSRILLLPAAIATMLHLLIDTYVRTADVGIHCTFLLRSKKQKREKIIIDRSGV